MVFKLTWYEWRGMNQSLCLCMQGQNACESLLLMEFEANSGWWKWNYYPATVSNSKKLRDGNTLLQASQVFQDKIIQNIPRNWFRGVACLCDLQFILLIKKSQHNKEQLLGISQGKRSLRKYLRLFQLAEGVRTRHG